MNCPFNSSLCILKHNHRIKLRRVRVRAHALQKATDQYGILALHYRVRREEPVEMISKGGEKWREFAGEK